MYIDSVDQQRDGTATPLPFGRRPEAPTWSKGAWLVSAFRAVQARFSERCGLLRLLASASLALVLALLAAPPATAQETIMVGVTTTGVPFTFVDTATRKPTGAMVDLASAIAADNGLQADFRIMAFPALIPALKTGKIDLISAGMFVTDERRKIVDFTTPVYRFGEAMFVAADDARDYTVDDLEGAVVGAQIGSTLAHALQSLGSFGQVKLYESVADIMRDVKLGRLKAGFGDEPIVAYQISQKPDLGVRIVKGYQPIDSGEVALAVAKGESQLLQKVNASLAKLKESGELAKIFAKYGL